MKVAVIFGGQSEEYEVSQNSAANVMRGFAELNHDVFKIGITKKGRWYLTEATPEQIADGTWEQLPGNRQVVLPHDPVVHGMLIFDAEDRAKVEHIDCIFPVLHGDKGEDGNIQGLFTLCEIPYVGCNTTASAVAMDKSVTKAVVERIGVRQASCYVLKDSEYERGHAEAIERIIDFHGDKFPLFVKPATKGSSVGAHRAEDYAGLVSAIDEAFEHDKKVLIEELIVGREIEVAVMGNLEPQASMVGEILTAGEFYDYDSKYNNPESQTRVIDDLPAETICEIRNTALRIYEAIGCEGLSRVDFFYSNEGEIVFNEINPIPGFTNISMYPQLWAERGIERPELIERLLAYAMEAHADWV